MVAFILRKDKNRDRYPDPPVPSRYSIGAVPRLVAPVAPVRFRVAAVAFWLPPPPSLRFEIAVLVITVYRLHSSVGRACA